MRFPCRPTSRSNISMRLLGSVEHLFRLCILLLTHPPLPSQPVGVGFASPHLTVASLISVRLSLLGAPTKLNIISIKCFVSQHFTIHYIDGKVVRPPPARYDLRAVDPSSAPSLCVPVSQMGRNMPLPPLKSNKYPRPLPPPADLPLIDPEPLAEVEKGEPYSFSRVMRIPIDDHVRATTLDGSETPIRVSHKLLVEVRYRAEAEAGDKIFLFGKDVTIGSVSSSFAFSPAGLHSDALPPAVL